jgi:hypothetical protein
MIDKPQWTLKEIRDAYGEILRGYNAIFPLHPQAKIQREDIINTFDLNRGDDIADEFKTKAKKILPKLKEAADQSGNALIWHRGESLDGLNQSMKERIEKTLKFGI